MYFPLWLSIFLSINAVLSVVISVAWLCRKKRRSLNVCQSDQDASAKTKKSELKNEGTFTANILRNFENATGKSEQDLLDTTSNDGSKRFEDSVLFIEVDKQILKYHKEDMRSCRSTESLNTFYSVQPRSGSMGRRCSFVSIISENI
ncbi:unnamed protein product [Acanthoscelides obtectus]|uniref:Uncharacterized protein n=1 Tax=Acanthoscelides obtectus TaxID=200917 RepID=A0A9P0P687_ACAOB|nr:unnamed protein product [Acanthoscelides obtectus]CAK1667359.1 hypothetical protein AOBTE_LOCUS25798 [Acanthoscelides obtectus]